MRASGYIRFGWVGVGLVGAFGPALIGFGSFCAVYAAQVDRLNFLIITADDMNWDTPGCYGGAAPDITPNIDRLAAEGMRFMHAHVTIAVCTPSRSVWLTGLYPHRCGVEGFQRIKPGVPTLPAVLGEAGYFCATIGKPLGQQETFQWSLEYEYKRRGFQHVVGRRPAAFEAFAEEVFKRAAERGQPFFLMANSHDPHRPFHGSDEARRRFGHPGYEVPDPSRLYVPGEVTIPSFLPDLPDIRREVAWYCNSVRRCDDTVGALLRALRRAGHEDDTVVMFLSDNGMSFPMAKTNCYLNSTRTPWIVRWPGVTTPGSVDKTHFVSGIDLMPTVLELAGVAPPREMDGVSFVPLLRGRSQPGRDKVFTQFYHIHGRHPYPMFCVQDKRFGYIFNPWSNGKRVYTAEPLDGLTFAAMKKAARGDTEIAARVKMIEYRTVEEFYDLGRDPGAWHNLIGDPRYTERIDAFRNVLLRWMRKTGAPGIEAFEHRDDPEALERFMRDYSARAAREIEQLKVYEERTGYRF